MEFSWTRAVSSQLSALVDMSRICVLDGFCYLILDGVSTFLQLVRPYMEECQIPSRLLRRIQRFVRGWGMLLDQAVRVDGQIIPSPGFSPVLYDIPVELLEFYNAFAFRSMVLLQSPEQENARCHYALFLLPKLCRRTKVQNIFHDPPPNDRLLYVDIPLDILYAPMQVLPQLCHELSHYCGENFRKREFRAVAILTACAHMIAWHFRLGNLNAVQKIRQDLNRLVPPEQHTYKKQLQAAIQGFFVQLFQHYEWVRPWQEAYQQGRKWASEEERTDWSRENTFQIRNIFFGRNEALADISQDIQEIFYLFEEGYADVSMMFLLSLSWEEYLALYRQELNWLETLGEDRELPTESGRRAVYARFVQRAALVLSATRCSVPSDFSALLPGLEEFSKHIIALEERMCQADAFQPYTKADEKMNQNCFPEDLLLDIRDYLEECWQEMQSTLADKEEVQQLRHIFGEVAREHHIGCDSYYETMARYERFLQR